MMDMIKKISVLYVCPEVNFVGASKSLYNMIEALRDYVRPIVLFSMKGEVYDYFVENDIRCIVVPFFYLWEKPKRLITILHHPSKSQFYRYWKIDRDCAVTVKNILGDTRIDIVHSNTTIATVGVDLARVLHAKHVWHVREYLDLDYGIDVFRGRKRLRKLINSAHARIVITNSVLQHWKLTTKSTHVIYNAVRHKYEMSQELEKEKYFLFASADLSETKGTSFAIRSFARSGLKNQGYKLKILGRCDEEYKYTLDKLITDFQLNGVIELLGYQTNVKEFYTRATAYLMTSKYEAMGRVTVDAMFYGCPVIARATGGSAEIIQHGYNGYMFMNENECAFWMNQIISNEEQIQQMIENAFREANENFSVEKYGEKIMKVYQLILDI